ncbi:response regulator transcription factor [Burkholderia ubonensis]|uniref:response regulator transcription factor n=1 Tax=Burkholderia ubonensis TaxID=101571 RepID=UPI0007C862A6|nr:response regulator transcription factor [Burkholderia ubonensis]
MAQRQLLGHVIRVAILDDHEVALRGVAQILSAARDVRIIGFCSHTTDLIALLRREACDIAIVDFVLSENDMDGLNMIRFLRVRFPDTKVVVFSGHDNTPTVDFSMRAGASGFFTKSQPIGDLITALRTVYSGDRYVPSTFQTHKGEPIAKSPCSRTTPCEDGGVRGVVGSPHLSPREREVLRCCLDGLSVHDMARKFNRSAKTIGNQRRAAFRKLGIRTLGELFKIHRQLVG